MSLFLRFSFLIIILVLVFSCRTTHSASRRYKPADYADSLLIRKIYDQELSNGECYENLSFLCKQIGARLTASPQSYEAINWGKSVLQKFCDTVFLQPVMVPHWVRGHIEEATILSDKKNIAANLDICALGNSVGTSPKGIRAEVIEVRHLEDIEDLGKERVKGKIIFFNRPMDEKVISTFQAYGGCVDQRVGGATTAAKYGAVGVLVRSLSLKQDEHPHTGVVSYDSLIPKIPAAALSTQSANELSAKLKKDPTLKCYLNLSCKLLPDTISYNVVGEIRGTTYPHTYIAVGGHLDSWDKGEGAHDDGAGIVQSIEVLRLFKKMGIKPRHTLRTVLFINEENGARGAKKYAEEANDKEHFHLFALESDAGGFTPRGFSVESDTAVQAQIMAWKNVLAPYGLSQLILGGSGVDVAPLKKQGTVVMGYLPDSHRYFDHHHADTDVLEAVHPRELAMGAAGMTALIYLLDKYYGNTARKSR